MRKRAMATEYYPRAMAIEMMQSALQILDQIEERDTALHLQHAIDTITGARRITSRQEMDAALETSSALAILERIDASSASPAGGSKPSGDP